MTFDDNYKAFYNEEVTPYLHMPTYGGSQIHEEFNRAWDNIWDIVDYEVKDSISFLEIGAYKGLWGLRLLYDSELYGIPCTYHTVTMVSEDSANNYLHALEEVYGGYPNHNFKLIDNDSTDPKNLEKLNKKYDFVFIDANHKYDYVMKDIALYSQLAELALIFHDIRPKEVTVNCGVYQAIQDSGLSLDVEIVTRGDIMGIGIIKINK